MLELKAEAGVHVEEQVSPSQPLIDEMENFVKLRMARVPEEELEAKLRQIKNLITKENVNEPGADDKMPLVVAARIGEIRIVEWMLNNGAYVDGRAGYCQITPLINAAIFKREDIVALLLAKKASVAKEDQGGQTALHKAVIENNENIVRQLLVYGADPLKKDLSKKSPKSPIDIAKEKQHTKVIEVFEEFSRKGFEAFLSGLRPNKGPDDEKGKATQSNIHSFFASSPIYEPRLLGYVASFMFPASTKPQVKSDESVSSAAPSLPQVSPNSFL